jgi:hypothetical protein
MLLQVIEIGVNTTLVPTIWVHHWENIEIILVDKAFDLCAG